MKTEAKELIQRLSWKSDPWSREAATMLERYLALADELEVESTYLKIGNVGYRQGVVSAAKRIWEIAEGESDEQ